MKVVLILWLACQHCPGGTGPVYVGTFATQSDCAAVVREMVETKKIPIRAECQWES